MEFLPTDLEELERHSTIEWEAIGTGDDLFEALYDLFGVLKLGQGDMTDTVRYALLTASQNEGKPILVKLEDIQVPMAFMYKDNTLYIGEISSNPDHVGPVEGPDGDGDDDDMASESPNANTFTEELINTILHAKALQESNDIDVIAAKLLLDME